MRQFMWTKILLMGMLFCLSLTANAAVSQWQIVPNESELTFTATQNGSPVTGKFKQFTGEIYFDPNDLAGSQVKIIVNTGSITTSYAEVADTLVTSDWFNAKLFPQAVFTANRFTKLADKTYQADGTLTIRNKTAPVKVTFTQEDYTATHARMKGSATLKRSVFGVGQGEWASTNEVKDDVQVNFVLSAVKKAP